LSGVIAAPLDWAVPAVALSQSRFDGDSEWRAVCPPERRFSADATSEEVPTGVD
jgi:hypothetical protein